MLSRSARRHWRSSRNARRTGGHQPVALGSVDWSSYSSASSVQRMETPQFTPEGRAVRLVGATFPINQTTGQYLLCSQADAAHAATSDRHGPPIVPKSPGRSRYHKRYGATVRAGPEEGVSHIVRSLDRGVRL